MDFIKKYWFGAITAMIIFVYFGIFILVLLSPRQDELKRGFIPCTEVMALEMSECVENRTWCMLKSLVKNSFCDMGVIGQGFADWAKGEQPTPWSNYIFVPEIKPEINEDDEGLQEYYQQNPNLLKEMMELKKMNKELEENEQDDVTGLGLE